MTDAECRTLSAYLKGSYGDSITEECTIEEPNSSINSSASADEVILYWGLHPVAMVMA